MATKKRAEKREKRKLSARSRTDEHQSGFSPTAFKVPEGVALYKPKAGARRIEIIPFVAGKGNPFADEGQLYFERTYWVHRGVGADENTYVCPKKTSGGKCPICDHRAKLAMDSDSDEDMMKRLAPKERQLWNVFDNGDPDKGVQVWDVSHHLFGKRLDTEIRGADEDDGFEFFADPEEGFTLRVTFEDKSFAGYAYVEAASINFKARSTPLKAEVLDAANVLDDLLIVKTFEDLKAIFLQTGDDEAADDDDDDDTDDDDEEEDEKPAKKSKPAAKSKPVAKKKPPVDDDDDDDDEEEDDDDDVSIAVGDFVKHRKFGECEVTTVSKDGTKLTLEDEDGEILKGVPVGTVTLATGSSTDDDDDDEDDEDEEEDEKPVKKSPRKR
jgi:hypothetical protein